MQAFGIFRRCIDCLLAAIATVQIEKSAHHRMINVRSLFKFRTDARGPYKYVQSAGRVCVGYLAVRKNGGAASSDSNRQFRAAPDQRRRFQALDEIISNKNAAP